MATGHVGQHTSHRFGSVVLHMLHIGVDDLEPELVDHAKHLVNAHIVRRDLRFKVGQVLIDVSTRVRPREQKLPCGLFAEHTVFDHKEVVDQHPFLMNRGAVWRRRSRCPTADIGVMATRRDVEQNLSPGMVEHRVDHRDVGQVGSAVVGSVDGVGITRFHRPVVLTDDRLDRRTH